MYSSDWFSTFSETIPPAAIDREVDALAGLFPLSTHRTILDVGCGIGRIAGPLAGRGYAVTGIDINLSALQRAQRLAPGPTYVAMDQRHLGLLNWRLDAAYVLWNSIGFVSRLVDQEVLSGLHRVIRPGGLLVMDMYHPTWLELNAEQSGTQQDRAQIVTRRWVSEGRLCNRIQYQDRHTDQIDFEVYHPAELVDLLAGIGFKALDSMVWWDSSVAPSADHARYQLLLRRDEAELPGAAV